MNPSSTIEILVAKKTQNSGDCIEGRVFYSRLIIHERKEHYTCRIDSNLNCEYQGSVFENPNDGKIYLLCALMENRK